MNIDPSMREYNAHPAVALAAEYEDVSDGCLFMVPYFLDIMGIHALQNGQHIDKVKAFILWTFAHLNAPDRWGLAGTVFDYVICCNGTEVSTLQYDSADGYAGQFLMLIELYLEKTGDKALFAGRRDAIYEIGDVILKLQEEDGLSIAMQSYPVKYLMDNGECHGGLLALERMAAKMGWKGYERFTAARKKMHKGIMEQLYDPERKIFYWAKEGDVKMESHWKNYYPDALAQVFPLLYDIVDKDSDLARELWSNFKKRHMKGPERDIEQKLLIQMTGMKMEGKK